MNAHRPGAVGRSFIKWVDRVDRWTAWTAALLSDLAGEHDVHQEKLRGTVFLPQVRVSVEEYEKLEGIPEIREAINRADAHDTLLLLAQEAKQAAARKAA